MRGVSAPTAAAFSPHHRCKFLSIFCFKYASSTFRALSTASDRPLLGSDRFQMKATKYWNDFYKRHYNKFFKDRHYLQKDWEHYFSVNPESQNSSKVVLEVGCGAGNTVFPLIAAFPHLFIHACDFSSNAIALVKSHEGFKEDQVNAFVCDVTSDDLCEKIKPSSVDVVTLFLQRRCP